LIADARDGKFGTISRPSPVQLVASAPPVRPANAPEPRNTVSDRGRETPDRARLAAPAPPAAAAAAAAAVAVAAASATAVSRYSPVPIDNVTADIYRGSDACR